MLRFLALCMVCVTCVVGCGETATAQKRPAVELAAIQAGRSVGAHAQLARQFQEALDNLTWYCRESARKISDEAVVSHGILDKHGRHVSYLSLLRHWYSSLPLTASPGMECTSVFAAFDTLMIDG